MTSAKPPQPQRNQELIQCPTSSPSPKQIMQPPCRQFLRHKTLHPLHQCMQGVRKKKEKCGNISRRGMLFLRRENLPAPRRFR